MSLFCKSTRKLRLKLGPKWSICHSKEYIDGPKMVHLANKGLRFERPINTVMRMSSVFS